MEWSFGRRGAMAAAVVLSCVLLIGSPASAGTRYLGDNLSRTVPGSGGKIIRVCDGERDGKRAYARYYRQGSGSTFIVIDFVGRDGYCADEETGRRVTSHQTCEVRGRGIGGGDDACTAFDAHS